MKIISGFSRTHFIGAFRLLGQCATNIPKVSQNYIPSSIYKFFPIYPRSV